jgi:hypothetical protein
MNPEEQTTDSLDAILTQFNTIVDTLSLFKMQISTVQQQIRAIEKTVKKELKSVTKLKQKEQNKKKREPCGFAKPTLVTKELCDFMNKPEGSKIARTAVTKALCSYIKENGLEDSSQDGVKGDRRINPDQKLKSLLGLQSETDEVTYFNIQKYMNKHFIKSNDNNATDQA